jgi:hypothetical protein
MRFYEIYRIAGKNLMSVLEDKVSFVDFKEARR